MTPSSIVKLLLALVGLTFGSAHAQLMMGMGMPMGVGYGSLGYLGGMSPMMGGMPGLYDGFTSELGTDEGFSGSLRLTCLNNNTNSRGYLTDAIAVTISQNEDGGFGSMGPMGMMGMDPYGFGFNQGSRRRGSPLKATVQLLSSAQGKGTIVFTKMARVEDGCSKTTMGGIHAPVQETSPMAGMGLGFNHMGMGMGMGMLGGGMPGMAGTDNEFGILKDDISINFNLQTIYIDNLDGFSSLSELAGRGVAVCSDSSLGWDWEAECNGLMYACCALKYDDHTVNLGLDTFDEGLGSQESDGLNDFARVSTVTYS